MNTFFSISRAVIYRIVGTIDRILGRSNPLFILCYHGIGSGWHFQVSKKTFEMQIKYISQTHMPVSLSQIEQHVSGKKRILKPAFAVTFDDGYGDILSVRDICKRYALSPTVFVLSDRESAKREVLKTQAQFLTTKEMKELIQDGWEIGSHTVTHAVVTEISPREQTGEIASSRSELSRELGSPINFFSYPKGRYSAGTIRKVKDAGYRLAVSMDDRLLSQEKTLFAVPRVGVDASHSFQEFPYLWSPSVIAFRNVIKRSFLGKYL